MFRLKILACVATVAVAAGASGERAVGQPFSTGYVDGGVWNTVYAQGFSPSESPSPDPGIGLTETVSLTRFQFFKSGNADTAANVQLAIISNFFVNLDTLTTSSPELVGLSSNTIASTADIDLGAPITFTFDDLALTYGENYAAIVVNNVGGDLNLALISALTANYTENPVGSGMYLPTTNYGDPDPNFPGNYFLATSNFTHTDAFGTYFDTFGGQGDANFTAYFNEESQQLAGDFNNDGTVNAADYVVWRKNNGTAQELSDWRANFGKSVGGSGGGSTGNAAAAPEPSTCLLCALFGIAGAARRPSRR